MNGITIMNGTALGKRAINSGEIQRKATDNEGSDDGDDDAESHGNNAVSTGNIQAVQLFSAPTTKCRVQLKDVIDLTGPNHNDIKLLKVSTIESRYWRTKCLETSNFSIITAVGFFKKNKTVQTILEIGYLNEDKLYIRQGVLIFWKFIELHLEITVRFCYTFMIVTCSYCGKVFLFGDLR